MDQDTRNRLVALVRADAERLNDVGRDVYSVARIRELWYGHTRYVEGINMAAGLEGDQGIPCEFNPERFYQHCRD